MELLEGHDSEVKCVSWDCTGKLLASCSRDKSIWIWEMDSKYQFDVVSVLRNHEGDVKHIAFHSTASILLSCAYDNTIKLWCPDIENTDEWYCYQTLTFHKSTVWHLTLNKNCQQFVSTCNNGNAIMWQHDETHNHSKEYGILNENEINYKIYQIIEKLHEEPIYCVDWLNNEIDDVNIIATCSGDNSIKILKIFENETNQNEKNEKKMKIMKISLKMKTVHCGSNG